MTEWYYSDGADRFGPVSEAEIENLIGAGTINADTLVWKQGLNDWVNASSQFSAFATGAQSAPSAPQGQPSAPPAPQPSMQQPSSYPSQTGSAYGDAAGPATQNLGPDGLYIGAPSRNFGEAVKVCFSKYATFSGRASRSEYWFFTLFNVLVGIATAVVDAILFPSLIDVSPINSIYSLAVLIPGLAVAWRRLHDTDRSGWWVGGFYLALLVAGVLVGVSIAASGGSDAGLALLGLLVIAALIYGIVLLVFFCQRGTPGPNRFG